jgi:hypothetical protein
MKEREFNSVDDVFIFKTLRDMRDLWRVNLDDGEKVVVTTLVDGHHGVHMPEILFEMANVKNVEEDWVQDMVCDILSDWTEGLQKHFDDPGWTIEYNEADGSIDVFYQDMDEAEKRENMEWAVEDYLNEKTPENFAAIIKLAISGSEPEEYTDGDVVDMIADICENVNDIEGIKMILKAYEVKV